ncbi:hypothetical protein H6P81_016128 [Aristolochia fimbriata]|uniref:Uncharacterized protein n=1 Tax=Aristolochia fimbriata TaxID=158543 RepID=A0AAV7E7J3_ARIFI|nr:hypothetical protein H6P81_016128 [Aristolochia fimbriata]
MVAFGKKKGKVVAFGKKKGKGRFGKEERSFRERREEEGERIRVGFGKNKGKNKGRFWKEWSLSERRRVRWSLSERRRVRWSLSERRRVRVVSGKKRGRFGKEEKKKGRKLVEISFSVSIQPHKRKQKMGKGFSSFFGGCEWPSARALTNLSLQVSHGVCSHESRICVVLRRFQFNLISENKRWGRDLRRSSAGVNGLRRTLSRISPYRFLTEFALTNLGFASFFGGCEWPSAHALTNLSLQVSHGVCSHESLLEL